jgi:hypothetical protein
MKRSFMSESSPLLIVATLEPEQVTPRQDWPATYGSPLWGTQFVSCDGELRAVRSLSRQKHQLR